MMRRRSLLRIDDSSSRRRRVALQLRPVNFPFEDGQLLKQREILCRERCSVDDQAPDEQEVSGDKDHKCEANHRKKNEALLRDQRASGKFGSISTGTSFSFSNAFCIAGRINANLSSIALAFSYEPSASIVNSSPVNLRTASLIFAGSTLNVPFASLNLNAPSSSR